jgi:hypothetical protein
MNNLLYQAGIIAIPLKSNENISLFPQPNYIVFDAQFGKTTTLSPNLMTGQLEETDCVQTVYKIVYREILEATEDKPEEYIERPYIPSENLSIPVNVLPLIFSHQRIKENINIVNMALSMFKFRGILSNFNLIVDEDKIDEILGIEAPEIVVEITPEPTPEVTPTETVEVTPEVTNTPDVTIEVTPEVSPTVEITPEITEETLPEPTATPDATPEVTNEILPEPTSTPEATPEITPTITE